MRPESVAGAPEEGIAARRSRSALGWLRLGLGAVWAANAVYILDPANDFFSSFSQVAASFGGSTLGGGGLSAVVAANPMVFSFAIAAVTLSLAVAFLSDVAVRAACVVGAAFNVVLLVTQWASLTTFPGGTDVGPQPLYLVGYVALYWGYHPGVFSVSNAVRNALARRRPHRVPAVSSVPGG